MKKLFAFTVFLFIAPLFCVLSFYYLSWAVDLKTNSIANNYKVPKSTTKLKHNKPFKLPIEQYPLPSEPLRANTVIFGSCTNDDGQTHFAYSSTYSTKHLQDYASCLDGSSKMIKGRSPASAPLNQRSIGIGYAF